MRFCIIYEGKVVLSGEADVMDTACIPSGAVMVTHDDGEFETHGAPNEGASMDWLDEMFVLGRSEIMRTKGG